MRAFRKLVRVSDPVIWLLAGLMLIGALWATTVVRAGAERSRIVEAGLRETLNAAAAYEQYLNRSIGQLDQMSMQLKHSAEQAGGGLDLGMLVRDGMFSDPIFEGVYIIDKTGAVRSATRAAGAATAFARSDFFEFHKNNNSTSVRIGPPAAAPGSAHAVVQVSRRLDSRDDEFDGVVLVTMKAAFFTDFFLSDALGASSMVAMVGTDTALRVERVHAGAQPELMADSLAELLKKAQADAQTPAPAVPAGGGQSAFPLDAALWDSNAGSRLVSGADGFADHDDRLLGWRRSAIYPVVAMVAVSHRDIVEAADLYWSDSRNNALLGTACIALLATIAFLRARQQAAWALTQDDIRVTYRTATESASEGFYMAVVVADPAAEGGIADFSLIDCNAQGARFYGVERATIVGSRLSTLDTGVFGEALTASYRRAMAEDYLEDERQVPQPQGEPVVWVSRRLVKVGNGLAITVRDVSQAHRHRAQLERLSHEDVLTGLPNRQALMSFLPEALAGARAGAASTAVLFIDIDEFRHVNDAHGEEVGDQLLAAVALRLKSLLRPADHIARFGPDQFVVLLLPADSDSHTGRVAERVMAAVEEPFDIGGRCLRTRISVGISIAPRDGDEAALLVKQAEIAMGAARAQGRANALFFDPSLSRALDQMLQLKQQLLLAIRERQFLLYFQPRVDTHTGRLCSFEALVRWNEPQRGLVPPMDFIPFAESSGLIADIGEQVMDMACAQLAHWRDAGLALVPVSINVSPAQFNTVKIHGQLAACLRRHDIPAGLLEVEITESAMMGDEAETIAELEAIRALGVKLHVDDFGTGYSSLHQLQKLHMDVLKVDRAFTAQLTITAEGRIFFQAIVSMAHALGMEVVAEGVETVEQLRILQQLGCNEVQGYYIGRPASADTAAALMAKGLLFPEAMTAPPDGARHAA